MEEGVVIEDGNIIGLSIEKFIEKLTHQQTGFYSFLNFKQQY